MAQRVTETYCVELGNLIRLSWLTRFVLWCLIFIFLCSPVPSVWNAGVWNKQLVYSSTYYPVNLKLKQATCPLVNLSTRKLFKFKSCKFSRYDFHSMPTSIWNVPQSHFKRALLWSEARPFCPSIKHRFLQSLLSCWLSGDYRRWRKGCFSVIF